MRAWLTGDEIPEETICRSITLPDDPTFRRALSGALFLLTQPENWEQFGALTPEAQAQAWLDILWTFESDQCSEGAPLIIGEIKMILSDTIPDGWLVLRGQEVSETTYPDLYALWGDDFTTGDETAGYFRLPDMRQRSPYGAVNDAEYGSKIGAASHAITTAEMPSHNHQVRNRNQAPANFHTGVGGANPSIGDVVGTTNSTTPNTTTNTGGNSAMSLLHPVILVNYIAWSGVNA